MIVDDEEDFRFIFSLILKRGGFSDVVEASDGRECLQRIKKAEPDLVFLDIMMPNMDGWEVCRRIKETYPHIPVSLLSAKSSVKDIKRSLEAGADKHLSKPISKEEILSAIQELGVFQTNNI